MRFRWQRESAWRDAGLREISAFLAAFFATWLLLRALFALFTSFWGLGPDVQDQIVWDNELLIQTLSLFSGILGAVLSSGSHDLLRRFGQNLPRLPLASPGSTERILALFREGFFRGFMILSAGLGLLVFSGYLKFEAISLSTWFLWNILPLALGQAFILFIWLMLIEASRSLLWRILIIERRSGLAGRLMLVVFEGHLLFRLLCPFDSVLSFDRIFVGFLAAFWAASILLEFERTYRPDGKGWRSAWVRISTFAGFSISLLHIYGFPLAGRRSFSLVHLFSGPLADRLDWSWRAPLMAPSLLLLSFVWLSNLTLQRILASYLVSARTWLTRPRQIEISLPPMPEVLSAAPSLEGEPSTN